MLRFFFIITALISVLVFAGISQAASVDVVNSSTMIRPAELAPANLNSSITLHVARNEYESAQIPIYAGVQRASQVTVNQVSAFTNGNELIPINNTVLYREDYYTVVTPSDSELSLANPCVGNSCLIPDKLIPEIDPLYGENRNAFPLDIPANQNRVAWLDFFVPATTLAGTYTASFQVKSNATVLGTITVNLVVGAQVIPATSRLHTPMAFWYGQLFNVYGGAANLPNANNQALGDPTENLSRMLALYTRTALQNRVSIARPYAYNPQIPASALFNTYVKPFVQPDSTAGQQISGTVAPLLFGATTTDVLIDHNGVDTMAEWKAAALAGNYGEKIQYYCDEMGYKTAQTNPGTANWDNNCNDPYAIAKAEWNSVAAPSLGTLRTAYTGSLHTLDFAKQHPYAVANESITTMIPLALYLHLGQVGWGGGCYDSHQINYPNCNGPNEQPFYQAWQNQDSRRQTWMYHSCISSGCGGTYGDPADPPVYSGSLAYTGWPSYHIDQPPTEARASALQAYNYKISGEYFFEMVSKLTTADNAGGQFYDGANGDGNFFYQGKVASIGGTHDIPLESIRLKRIRDGREDYEYLMLLDAAGKTSQAREITGGPSSANAQAGLLPDMWHSAPTPGAMETAHTQLWQLLLAAPVAATCNGQTATIVGTVNNDNLVGTAGNDIVSLGAGNDTYNGLGGNDLVCGDAGDDHLTNTGAGNNSFFGMEGEDTLVTGGGDDKLNGGLGYDTFTPGFGLNSIDAGNDTGNALDYRTMSSGMFINLQNKNAGNTGAGASIEDSWTGSINEVYATASQDLITGASANEYLSGMDGNDRIIGNGGNDNLQGGNGADTLNGGSGDDLLNGGPGTDLISYDTASGPIFANLLLGQTTGADGIDFLASVEDIQGSAFNDQLTGSAGANYLFGGAGDDQIIGNAGADTLRGEAGNDELRAIDNAVDDLGCGVGIDIAYPDIEDLVNVDCETISGNHLSLDQCNNIIGQQLAVPLGYDRDLNGNCLVDLINPPIDRCNNIGGSQVSIPAGYYAENGSCFKKETPGLTLHQYKAENTRKLCGASLSRACVYKLGQVVKLGGKVQVSKMSLAGKSITLRFYKLNATGVYQLVHPQTAKPTTNQSYLINRSKFTRGKWRVIAFVKETDKTNPGKSLEQYLTIR